MGFSLLLGIGLSFFACSTNPGQGSGGAGGTRDCKAITLVGPPCDPCVHERCCAELSVCDDECVDCLLGGAVCTDRAKAAFKCIYDRCLGACSDQPNDGGGGAGGLASGAGP